MPPKKKPTVASLKKAIQKAINEKNEETCNQLLRDSVSYFSLFDWDELLLTHFIEISNSWDMTVPVKIILDSIAAYYPDLQNFLKKLQVILTRINFILRHRLTVPVPTPPWIASQISERIYTVEQAILQQNPCSLPPDEEDAVEYIFLHYVQHKLTMHAILALRDFEKEAIFFTNRFVIRKLFTQILHSIKEILTSKMISVDEKKSAFIPTMELLGKFSLCVDETEIEAIVAVPEQLSFILLVGSACVALKCHEESPISTQELFTHAETLPFDSLQDYRPALSPLFQYGNFLSNVTYTIQEIQGVHCLVINGALNTHDNPFTFTSDSGIAFTVNTPLFIQELHAVLHAWHPKIQYKLNDANQFVFVIPYAPCARLLLSATEQKTRLLHALTKKAPNYRAAFHASLAQRLTRLQSTLEALRGNNKTVPTLLLKMQGECAKALEGMTQVPPSPCFDPTTDWPIIVQNHPAFDRVLSLSAFLHNPEQAPKPLSDLTTEWIMIEPIEVSLIPALSEQMIHGSPSTEDLQTIAAQISSIESALSAASQHSISFLEQIEEKRMEFNTQLDALEKCLRKLIEQKIQALENAAKRQARITQDLKKWSMDFASCPGIETCLASYSEPHIFITFHFATDTTPIVLTYQKRNFSVSAEKYLKTLKEILAGRGKPCVKAAEALAEDSTEDDSTFSYQCLDTQKPSQIFNRTEIAEELAKALWYASKEYRKQYKEELSQRCEALQKQLQDTQSELAALHLKVKPKESEWTMRRDTCFAAAQLVRTNYHPSNLSWEKKDNAVKMIKTLKASAQKEDYTGSTFRHPISLELDEEFAKRAEEYHVLQTQLTAIAATLSQLDDADLQALMEAKTTLDQLSLEQKLQEQKNKNKKIAAHIALHEHYCAYYEELIAKKEQALQQKQQEDQEKLQKQQRKNQQKKDEKKAARQARASAAQKTYGSEKTTAAPTTAINPPTNEIEMLEETSNITQTETVGTNQQAIKIKEIVAYLSQLDHDFRAFSEHFQQWQVFSYFFYDYCKIRRTIAALVEQYAALDQETLKFLFPEDQVTVFIADIKTFADQRGDQDELDKRASGLMQQFIILTEYISQCLVRQGYEITKRTPIPSAAEKPNSLFWQAVQELPAQPAVSSAYLVFPPRIHFTSS